MKMKNQPHYAGVIEMKKPGFYKYDSKTKLYKFLNRGF